jgi:putative endonuclease
VGLGSSFGGMKQEVGVERGVWGERIAAGHLLAAGYRIVERNWRYRRCEIDLIATRGHETIFVEVKVRGAAHCGEIEDVVSTAQRRRLIRAAHMFLVSRRGMPGQARFDLIRIVTDARGWKLEHVPDAFLPDPA